MSVQELLACLRAAGSKVLNAAEQCATSEELMKLAEAHDIILTKEEAGKLLDLLQRESDELSSVELEAVAGGSSWSGIPLPCQKCFKIPRVLPDGTLWCDTCGAPPTHSSGENIGFA